MQTLAVQLAVLTARSVVRLLAGTVYRLLCDFGVGEGRLRHERSELQYVLSISSKFSAHLLRALLDVVALARDSDH